jgi:hypothetical protein
MTKSEVLAKMEVKIEEMTNKAEKGDRYFLGMAVAWDNARRLVKEKLTKI